jgi:SsrA-binding protein
MEKVTVPSKKEKSSKSRGLPAYINRKAFHDYTIEEKFEAGIALAGQEVKSIRSGGASLTDSYAQIKNDEVILFELNISPYKFTTYDQLPPRRPRRLLLNKREIRKIKSRTEEKGMTLIPLRIYFVKQLVKVELGLCRGKREYEKRDVISKKEANREKERALRERD